MNLFSCFVDNAQIAPILVLHQLSVLNKPTKVSTIVISQSSETHHRSSTVLERGHVTAVDERAKQFAIGGIVVLVLASKRLVRDSRTTRTRNL